MTEMQARERLARMVHPNEFPELDEVDLDDLLRGARRVDADGRAPTDADWTGTWNLNAAAAEGWLRKAGKVAGAYAFSTDGQSFQRPDAHRMCMLQVRRYAARGGTSVGSAPNVYAWRETAVNTNG